MNNAIAVRHIRLEHYPGIALGFAATTRTATERQPIFHVNAEYNSGGVLRVWNADRIVFGAVTAAVKVNLLYIHLPFFGPCLFTTPIPEIIIAPPSIPVLEVGQLVIRGDAAAVVLSGYTAPHRTIDVPTPRLVLP